MTIVEERLHNDREPDYEQVQASDEFQALRTKLTRAAISDLDKSWR